jgi:hypothetical protein
MRSKYITEKKTEINKNVPILKDQPVKLEDNSKMRKTTTMFANSYEPDDSYQKQ